MSFAERFEHITSNMWRILAGGIVFRNGCIQESRSHVKDFLVSHLQHVLSSITGAISHLKFIKQSRKTDFQEPKI